MAEIYKDGALGASVTLDTESVKQGSQEAIKSIDNLEKSVDKLGKTVDDTEKQLKGIGVTSSTTGKELKDSFNNAVEAVRKYANESDKTKASADGMQKAIDAFNTKLNTMPKTIEEVNKHIKELQTRNEQLNTQLNNAKVGTAQYNDLNKQLHINSTALANCRNLASDLTTTYEAVANNVGALASATGAWENVAATATGLSTMTRIAETSATVGQVKANEQLAKSQKTIIDQTEVFIYTNKGELETEKDKLDYINQQVEAYHRLREAKAGSIEVVEASNRLRGTINNLGYKSEDYDLAFSSKHADVQHQNTQAATSTIKNNQDKIRELEETRRKVIEEKQSLEVALAEYKAIWDTLPGLTKFVSRWGSEYKEAVAAALRVKDLDVQARELAQQIENEKNGISTAVEELDKTADKKIEAETKLSSKIQSHIEDGNIKVLQSDFNSLTKEVDKLDEAIEKIKAGGKGDFVAKQGELRQKEADLKAVGDRLNELKEKSNGAGESVTGLVGSFKKLSGAIGSALMGNVQPLIEMLSSMGGIGAAATAGIAAIAAGIAYLTVKAEELRVALMPLGHYVDDGVLTELKNEFVDLQSQTTKTSTDMAGAATRWVKAFKGIRDNKDVIVDMVKSSNEFGALTGQTSEQAAKSMAKMAVQYRLTASDAKEMGAIIANVAKESPTDDINEVTRALEHSGTTAVKYGASFKDMAAFIAVGSREFGGAQEASSGLNMMLMKLSNQANNNFNPRIVGLTKAFQNLKEAQEKGQVVDNLFQGRQRDAARIFINNADAIAQYKENITDATEKNKTLADASSKAKTNVAKLTNAWDEFCQTLNVNVTPAIVTVINALTWAINKISSFASYINSIELPDWVRTGMSMGVGAGLIHGVNSLFDNDSKSKSPKERVQEEYQRALQQAKKLYPKASANAIANAAQNATLKWYSKNDRGISAIDYNAIIKKQRDTYLAEAQATTGGSGVDKTPFKDKNDEKKAAAAAKKAAAEAERQRKAQQKYEAILDKNNTQKKRASEDMEMEIQQAILDAMIDGAEKQRLQRDLDNKKAIQQIEREAEDRKKALVQQAKAEFESQYENKGKSFDAEAYVNSSEYKKGSLAIDTAKDYKLRAQQAQYKKEQLDVQKQNSQYLLDYIKEYGSMSDKRLAIEKEYYKKVEELRKAGATESQIAAVQKEGEKAIKELTSQDVFNNIDWDNVFGDLQGYTKKFLIDLRNELKDVLKSGSLKSIEDIEKVQDKLREINTEISQKGGIFDFTGSYAIERSKLISKRNDAYSNVSLANTDVSLAQAEVNRLKQLGIGGEKLAIAETNLAKAREELTKATKKAQQAEEATKNTRAQKIAGWFNGVDKFVSKNGIDQLPDLFTELGLGKVGEKVGNGLSAYNNASSAAANLAKGNYIGAALNAVSAVKDFGKMFGIGVDKEAEKAAELKEQYQALSTIWDELISKKQRYIDISYGNEAAKAYDEAKKYLEAQEKLARENAAQALNVRNGGHSMEKRMWNGSYVSTQGRTWSDVAGEIKNGLGITVNSMQDFTKLSSEQLQWIKEKYVDLWAVMDGDFKQYLEDIISYGDKAKELGEDLQTALASVSFDDFYASWESMLTDLDSENKDFAENFGNYLKKSILQQMLANEYKSEIQSLYDEWQKAADSDGDGIFDLTDQEAKDLEDKQARLTERILQRREELVKQYGLDTTTISDYLGGLELDTFKSDFQSLISDMDNTSKEFADNFASYMRSALIQSMVKDKYADQLEALYNEIGEAAKNGTLDEEAIQKYKAMYTDLADAAQKDAEAIDKITKATENYLTSTLDNFQSSMQSAISNLDSTSEDFAQNFGEYLRDALISSMVENTYGEAIKSLYNEVIAATNGGNLSSADMDALTKKYTDLAQQMQASAQAIADITVAAENYLDISVDGLQRNLSTIISDFDKSADDFAETFKNYMKDALIESMINDTYGEAIKALYKQINEAANSDGIDAGEMDMLTKQYTELAQAIQKSAEEIDRIVATTDNLLSITADDFKNRMKSAISDLDATSKDFAENFRDYIQDALTSSMIENTYGEAIKALYKEIMDAANSDGMSEEEITALTKKYQELMSKIHTSAKEIQSIVGETTKYITSSFDSIESSFISTISNIMATTEDFSDSIIELMFTEVLNAAVKKGAEEELKQWYAKFSDYINGGGDLSSDSYKNLMQEYTDLLKKWSEKAQSIADELGYSATALAEKKTQITFDSLKSGFLSLLMNMDSKSRDFADNFTEYLQAAILNAQLTDLLDTNLKRWYDNFAQAMEDGNLSNKEVEDLRAEYNAIVENAIKQRDLFAEVTGYNNNSAYSQEATSRGFTEMSEDTANELNGRFTALQISGESIENNVSLLSNSVNGMAANIGSIKSSIDRQTQNIEETKSLQQSSYFVLTKIQENTGNIATTNILLQGIQSLLKRL